MKLNPKILAWAVAKLQRLLDWLKSKLVKLDNFVNSDIIDFRMRRERELEEKKVEEIIHKVEEYFES